MFIQPNRTKAKLQVGQAVFGVIATSDDPQFAELCGIAGMDFFMLDAEHGLVDAAQAVNVIRACERTGITPLVRIGPKDPKLVLQYMDAGMMGVMMPGLNDVEELRMLVNAVKYPPLGTRGIGLSRASAYMAYGGEAEKYIKFANEQSMVIAQFEDPNLIDALPEMLGVSGLDAVMIGPRDLSLLMGFPDGPHHAEVQTMIDRVIGLCNKCHVAAGMTANTQADASREVARGAMMILSASQSLQLAGIRTFITPQ
jgi:4-hydroxy-2-oxoheptanedioate aldolase